MNVETILQLADVGTTGVLLVVLWQGLQRFDRLLDLIIKLAELNANEAERKELRDIRNS